MKTLFLVIVLFFLKSVFSQKSFKCLSQAKVESMTTDAYQKFKPKTIVPTKSTYNIPVVVHHLYNNSSQEMTESEIESLINSLNERFSASLIDTLLINPIHRVKITDANINFCLAQIDDQGNSTTGIERIYTDSTSFDVEYGVNSGTEPVKHSLLGGAEAWDVNTYLNIWIGTTEDPNSYLSYAVTFGNFWPLGSAMNDTNLIQGVFLDANLFFGSGLDKFSQILAHEVGHYFGLLHTFGNSAPPSCNDDDQISDTPTCGIGGVQCSASSVNTCTDPTNDEPDNVANFMNYSDCNLMFTPEQVSVMQTNLQTKPGLYTNTAICTVLGKNELEKSSIEFVLWPNPTNGKFKFRVNLCCGKSIEISMSNSLGVQLWRRQLKTENNEIEESFAMNLSNGVYFITVTQENTAKVEKIIIRN